MDFKHETLTKSQNDPFYPRPILSLITLSSSYAKILGETNFHTREFPPEVGQKQKMEREREIFKWGGEFSHMGDSPEVGQKQKMERKRKRLNDGNTKLGLQSHTRVQL